MDASDVARFVALSLTLAGCGRGNYRGMSDADLNPPDAARDANAQDAFNPIDAFTRRDGAFTASDAFSPTSDAFSLSDAFIQPDAFIRDAFVPPDTYTGADAWSVGSRPLALCNSTSLSGELANFARIGSIGTGPFTFETWLKTVDGSVSIIVGHRDPDAVGFLLGLYGGSPFVQLRSVPNIAVARVVNDDLWHHVAVRRDDVGNLSALVDFTPASLDFAVSSRDIDPVSALLHVGSDSSSSGGSPYLGQLRLLRIWNRRLSDAELTSNARTVLGPTSRLLFELPLDETGITVQETATGVLTRVGETSARVTDCIPPG